MMLGLMTLDFFLFSPTATPSSARPGIGIKSMRVCYPCLEARGVDCDRLESPKSLFSTRESRRRVLHSLHSVSGPSNR